MRKIIFSGKKKRKNELEKLFIALYSNCIHQYTHKDLFEFKTPAYVCFKILKLVYINA